MLKGWYQNNCKLDDWTSLYIEGLFGWRGKEVGEQKVFLVFSCMFLVGRLEKWRNEKLICLAMKKNEMMKSKVDINLFICPYYII